MKLFTSAIVGAVMLAGQATAATLSLVGGTATALPGTYNPAPPVPGTAPGTIIQTFDRTDIGGQGLMLNGDGKVTFTFLGKEAGADNSAIELDGNTALSNNDPSGTSISGSFSSGLLAFLFETLQKGSGNFSSIENGVGATGPLKNQLGIGFLKESNRSFLAFFGDGRGDLDYDDMVIRISTVPVPAGLLLMLTAVGGLGVAARRRKA